MQFKAGAFNVPMLVHGGLLSGAETMKRLTRGLITNSRPLWEEAVSPSQPMTMRHCGRFTSFFGIAFAADRSHGWKPHSYAGRKTNDHTSQNQLRNLKRHL